MVDIIRMFRPHNIYLDKYDTWKVIITAADFSIPAKFHKTKSK